MKKPMVLAAFVAVVSFAVGGVAFSAHDFPDVPDSHPFHDDISWLASTGITEGFADGTYKPGQAVTRQSMAAFMRRLAGADPDVDPMVDAALLEGRTPADLDDAVTLAGRTPADYDNAVTLNGRTPADYDNAVTLNGRTPADYDNAVTLNGRTPADYDNAVTLNGRTPADYDDAETLDGYGGGSFMRSYVYGVNSSSRPIVGISSGTASPVYSAGAHPDLIRYVFVTGLIDTSFDAVKMSCQVDGSALPELTDINLGDNAIGYTDRLPISVFYVVFQDAPGALSCWYESPVGTGALEVEHFNAVQMISADFSAPG